MIRDRYDSLTQGLHWLTFAAVAAVFVSAQIMEEMARGSAKAQMVGFHVSMGVAVLALTLVRLARRWTTTRPAPIVGSPIVQTLAKAMHATLYLTLMLVPVVGIAMLWAKGRSVGVFGLFTLPPLIGPDRVLAGQLEDMHEIAADLILVLVGLHAAAGIMHQFVLRDGAIARMLPFGKPTRI